MTDNCDLHKMTLHKNPKEPTDTEVPSTSTNIDNFSGNVSSNLNVINYWNYDVISHIESYLLHLFTLYLVF